jgi:hypothetical protein
MPPKKNKAGSDDKKDKEKKKVIETEADPQWTENTVPWSFPILRNDIRQHEAEEAKFRERLPDLRKQHTKLLEAGDEEALKDWYKNEGKHMSREYRRKRRESGVTHQAVLEDFLYHQNQAHRLQRWGPLRDAEVVDGDENKKTRRPVYRISRELKLTDLRRIIDKFDKLRTGSAAHMNGLIDWKGHPVKQPPTERLVPPRELRLWTPVTRRAPGGLRHAPLEIVDHRPLFDLEAIEARRYEIDSRENTTEGVRHSSHNERRQEEVRSRGARHERSSARAHDQRPSTSGIFPGVGADGQPTLDRYRGPQTDQGLFMSALESSHDWRTSYDYLGPVKSGFHVDFEVSAERDTVDGPPSKKKGKKAEKNSVLSKKRGGKAAGGRGGKAGATKRAKTGEENESGEEEDAGSKLSETAHVMAELDYPYEQWEFEQDAPKPQMHCNDSGEQIVHGTTTWAEETTGRREWHVHMNLSPPSSVDSPPHSPIPPEDIDTTTIPQAKDITTSLERRLRRCSHDPERCRAWWTHDPDECWIVESELKNPDDSAESPPPENFGLPDSGIGIYDSRLPDHYGIYGSDDAIWPKLGIRVPYEPMTHDDLKLKPGSKEDGLQAVKVFEKGGFIATDAEDRSPYEVHSMAVPIIRNLQHGGKVDKEVLELPGDAEDAVGGSGDEESELDTEDDQDLFHKAYMQGIAGVPTPAPPAVIDLSGHAVEA